MDSVTDPVNQDVGLFCGGALTSTAPICNTKKRLKTLFQSLQPDLLELLWSLVRNSLYVFYVKSSSVKKVKLSDKCRGEYLL